MTATPSNVDPITMDPDQPLHEAVGSTPTVRASFHVYNRREDVDALADTLEAITALV